MSKRLIEVEIVTGTVILREMEDRAIEPTTACGHDDGVVLAPTRTIAAGTPAAACQALKKSIEEQIAESKED